MEGFLEQDDGKLLIGGKFTTVNGQPAGDIVRLNRDGSNDTNFNTGTGFSYPGLNSLGAVGDFEVQEDGKILVLGRFDTFNGEPAHNLVRLNSDGSRDTNFNAGSGGIVQAPFFPAAFPAAMAVLDNGQILVSGYISGWDGHLSDCVVRLNADGSVDTNFQFTVESIQEGPMALLLYRDDTDYGRGRIQVSSFVGGVNVASVNGVALNSMNYMDQNGNFDQDFSDFFEGLNFDGQVWSWNHFPDGKIRIGGNFTELNGIPAAGFATIQTNGTVDQSLVLPEFFGPPWFGGDGAIFEILPLSDGKYLAFDYFTHVDGVPRNSLARLNSDGSLDLSFDPGAGPRDEVGDVSLIQPASDEKNGTIYMLGPFVTYDGVAAQGLVRILLNPPPPVKINTLVRSSGGVVTLDFTKTTDAAVVLEWTENFSAWFGAGTNTQAAGTYQMDDAAELASRQRAYASDMNVAMQALDGSNLGRALDLLNRQRPQPGQKDLRGWEWRYLWAETHSDALLTLCQRGEVQSLAASADGNWLAIGQVHQDGLYVYDLQTRREVAHLAPGEGEVRVAFSPVESLLGFTSSSLSASGGVQAKLRLWNAATQKLLAELPLDAVCLGLAFAKDGRTLVTSTGLGNITLWRIPEGTKLASYPSEQQLAMNPATDFAATADLRLAAYATRAGQIRVLNLQDGKELWSAVAAKQFITALAFSPDGKTLASAAGFGESDIRLWDVASGKETGRLEGHKGWVGSLVFWPDGQKLASSSADQTIRIWDVASRNGLDVLRGHRLEVWRLALLPDGHTLVSGAKDGAVCLWDTSLTHARPPRIVIPDHVFNWCFMPNSRSVLTLNSQGQVARWRGVDFQQKEPVLEVGTVLGWRGMLIQNCLSPDGRFLAVGFTNGTLSVWDLSLRILRREFKLGDGNVYPLSFLARGNRLVVYSQPDNRLCEWDLEANREAQSWPAPGFFDGFGVSPDERLGVGIGWHGDVSARNLSEHSNTNLPLDVLEGWRVTFSLDGAYLAVPSAMGYARVWNTATWQEEATLRGFLNSVGSVAFSPNGRRLATGGSNPFDAVKLWDMDSWQELLTLEGAGSQFNITSFASDGNGIGSMSIDGVLNLWRAPSWEEINAAEAKEKAESKQP